MRYARKRLSTVVLVLTLIVPNTVFARAADAPAPGKTPAIRKVTDAWFILVTASFVFIWLVTGAVDTITGSLLALVGIGAGTALGGDSVWGRLAMPQFSDSLLGLMGISAGTYLGFKIPESRA